MGHDDMHAEMVLVLFMVTIAAQVALVIWKKRHFKSYQVSERLDSFDNNLHT